MSFFGGRNDLATSSGRSGDSLPSLPLVARFHHGLAASLVSSLSIHES